MGDVLSCHDPRSQTLDRYTDLPYQKRPDSVKCLLSDAGTYPTEKGPEVTLHTRGSPGSRRHQTFLPPDVLPKGRDYSHGDVNRNDSNLIQGELEEGCHTLPKRRSFRKQRPAPPPPPGNRNDQTPLEDGDISNTRITSMKSSNGKIPSGNIVPMATSTPRGNGVRMNSSDNSFDRDYSTLPTKPSRRMKRGSSSGITESSSNSSLRSSPPTLPRRPPPKPPRSFTYKRGQRLSGNEATFLSEMPSMDMSIGSKLDDSEHFEIYENLSYAMRSKRLWQVITISKDIIIDRLDPQIVMCRLSEKRVVTVEDENEVYNRLHKLAMNQAIVDVLLSKTDEEFDEFCACLHLDECHKMLAEVLDVINEIFKIVLKAKIADGLLKPGQACILLGTHLNCDISYHDRVSGRIRPVTELDDTKSMLSVTFDSSMNDMCHSPSSFSFDGERFIPMVSVDLFEQNLHSNEITALASLLEKYSCISELSIAKGGMDSHTTSCLASALEMNKGLIKLDIRLNPSSNDGVHSIANALTRNCSLKALNLSHTSLLSGGARQILDMLLCNEVLEDLDISFNELDDSDCKFLATAIEGNHTLRNLRARSNALSPLGCRDVFRALCTNDHLVVLDISSNEIGDDGAAAISVSLPKVRGLKELNLEKSKIGASGAVKIANGLRDNMCIENLDISMNSIGDEGACAFAGMLQTNKTLTSLSMNMCSIGRPGFSKLVDSLEVNAALRVLKVCFNNVGRSHGHSPASSGELSPISSPDTPVAAPDPLVHRVQDIIAQRDIQVLLWGNRLDS